MKIDNIYGWFSLTVIFTIFALLAMTIYKLNYDYKIYESSIKKISVYEYDNSTSIYYHNFEEIPDDNVCINTLSINQCEQICKDVFYDLYENSVIAVNEFNVESCYKRCNEDYLINLQ